MKKSPQIVNIILFIFLWILCVFFVFYSGDIFSGKREHTIMFPCPEGQILVEKTCVTPTEDNSDLYAKSPFTEIKGSFTIFENIKGYISVPQENPWSTLLLLLHDTMGIDESIQKIADLYAGEGYIVFVPELFIGEGVIKKWIQDSLQQLPNLIEKQYNTDSVIVLWWWKGGTMGFDFSTSYPTKGTVVFYGEVDSEKIPDFNGTLLWVFTLRDALQSEEYLRPFYDTMLENQKSVFFQFYDEIPWFMNPKIEAYGNTSTIDAYELSLSFMRGLDL